MTQPSHHLHFRKLIPREIALGGVCWLLSLGFFVGQAVAQAAWRTPYSLIDNPISDLGSTSCSFRLDRLGASRTYVCSPWHVVMNSSFIVTGILILLGLYFTRRAWPKCRFTTWGFVFLALTGLGKIVVGFAPENVNHILHDLGGLGIICGNLSIVLLGLAHGLVRRWTAGISLVLGGVGLFGTFLFISTGLGLAERLADYPTILWMAVLGVSFLLWWRAGLGHEQPAST